MEGAPRICWMVELICLRFSSQPLTVAVALLGIAVANWVTVLALDTVIIGGGVTEALGMPLVRRVRASFKENVFPRRCRKANIVMTKLMDEAGMLGAALLARTQHTRPG